MKSLENLDLAVVGHVEWVTFIGVDHIPQQGLISHGNTLIELPAGGGAVAAVQMAKLTKRKVHFFTALGNDLNGQKCYKKLRALGLEMHVAWKEKPTRKGFSFVGENGERAITVIGERIEPTLKDDLPWELVDNIDGVFITATNAKTLQLCRKAKIVCATPRVKAAQLNGASLKLDALIGSNLDPYERDQTKKIHLKPKITISTEGALGGLMEPGGRFKAIQIKGKIIDSYGCGDSFAAGMTTGMAAQWDIKRSIELGAKCGADCATFFGPY